MWRAYPSDLNITENNECNISGHNFVSKFSWGGRASGHSLSGQSVLSIPKGWLISDL